MHVHVRLTATYSGIIDDIILSGIVYCEKDCFYVWVPTFVGLELGYFEKDQ